MRSYSSKEIMELLKKDGWFLVSIEGSFKHPSKPGKVTLKHPCKDVPRKTLASIAKQSGLIF